MISTFRISSYEFFDFTITFKDLIWSDKVLKYLEKCFDLKILTTVFRLDINLCISSSSPIKLVEIFGGSL